MRAFTLRATVVIVGTLVATITIVHSLVYLSIDRSILSVEMPSDNSKNYPANIRASFVHHTLRPIRTGRWGGRHHQL
jgi:hypothetical protein